MMSIEKDNTNNIGRLLEPNSSLNKAGQLRLYYVRMHEVKDKLKVHLDFGKNITFTFGEGKHLHGKDNMGPVIYTLDLMLIMTDNAQLYVEHNEQFKSIGEYRLNISHITVIGKHFEEKRDLGHSLCDYLEHEHIFLFDIHFHSYYGFHLPGEDTGLFTDLCLFTCYLLSDPNLYDLFNILVDQFRTTEAFTRRDFQEFFEKCLKYLQYTSTDLKALIVIVRMIALLPPIKKENFDRNCLSASEFINKIMCHIRTDFLHLLKFETKDGLAILSAFELFYQKLEHSNDNKLDYLHQISDEKLREDIANKILLQLSRLEQPIIANSNWADLFTMVNPQEIKINYLNLAASFETLIISITKISRVLKDYHRFEKQLSTSAFYDYLPIDLDSILYLSKFFEQKPSDDCVATQHLLTIVQSTIGNSYSLKQKIAGYFNKLELNLQNMEEIQLIICFISKCPILDYIDKYEYLERSLNLQSIDYYIKWFQCFLANSRIRDETQQDKEKKLLESWIKDKDLTCILMAIDRLLAPFDPSDWFCLYFIDRIIELCFQQDSIFSVITDSLLHVQHELFRAQFITTFDRVYFTSREQKLYELVELDKRENSQSMLVHDLIELICEKIELTKDYLIQDTFHQPTKSTLTYLILFDQLFANLPIRIKMIGQLISMWNEWEDEGFQVADINSWHELKEKQREIACRIWNLIGENHDKTIRFEQLIDSAAQKIESIIRIKESVRSYLNNYCQDACDKNDYFADLDDIENQLKREKIYLIKIPQTIEAIHRFTDRLNSIVESHVWQKFLHRYDIKIEVDQQQITCLTILKQTEAILDLFTKDINNLWNDRTQPILPQLEQLFPEKYLIDHEFDIIKRLLDRDIVPYVEQLLHYWKNHEHIIHICRGYFNLLEKYQIKNPEIESILQNILDINEQTTGEACLVVYQDYITHFTNKYSDLILNFLSQWSLSNELLKFLYDLNMTDVENLLDVVNDWDETLMNTRTVLEFVLLKNFFDQADVLIKSVQAQKPLEFSDLRTCFEQIWRKSEFKNLSNLFKLCSASLSSIQHILTASTDKEQSKRKRILEIMQNAHFGFCVHRLTNTISTIEHEFDVCVRTDNHSKTIYFTDLSELRDRARLIEYANNSSYKMQKYTDDDIQQIRSIISFTETIEMVLKSLTALHRAGYPCLTQFLIPKKEFVCNQGNYEEMERFRWNLETELTDWDKQLCAMYEKCIDLTYFSYQQIWIVEKSLYERTVTSIDPGYHLLQFIGIDPQSIRWELLPSPTEEYYERLKNMAQIFNTQRMHRNSLQQEDEPMNKKIFLIQTSYKGILRAIFSLFNRSNLSVNANQLFYCTKNTNWIEIRAFIYRCFYSQKLHQLIQPELLPIVIQDQFTQLLNQLIEQNLDQVFYIGVITTVSTTHLHLVNGLKIHRMVQTLYDQDLLSEGLLENKIRTLIGDNCILVTSRIAGLGKSNYIRNEASRLGKKLIKFPISGAVNIDTLTDRLRNGKIQSASSPVAIHIDIGPVENIQQFNEFLYCLILFRCFRLGQMPVCVPADIPIYIEVDSSSYLAKFIDDIIIFKYLTTKYIDTMDWNDLKTNLPMIQFVANYLQAIEDKTINTRDINQQTITTLDKSTCIRLLQKYFLRTRNTEFISWTQLSIFIAVYYKLFSGFSKCGYFVVDSTDQPSLRLDILNSLLDSSDQFTSLSVENVRQNQRSIHTNETSIGFSDAIIRWDKSQPFTLIFTSTYEPLFIYKSLTNVPSSLTEAFLSYYHVMNKNYGPRNGPQRLFHSLFKKLRVNNNVEQAATSTKNPEQQLQEFLINPNRMTHEQFFLRLTSLSTKYFTPKSICLTCFNQFKYDEQQCFKCPTRDALIRPISTSSQHIEEFQKRIAEKIHSEYVFTPDNYIKMLLIYLRVQSNLPVLIMGETGCGKTALIRCLCEKILDDEMEVFHIHAGITNDKIIEIMHDFTRTAQKCSEKDPKKRLWVFFDEFNTTPNIGLLKEIVCQRTFLGEPLPKNMVFLGACNPQRRKKDNQELQDNIGIKKYYLDVQRLTNGVDSSLLYSVVPIPETMLEHIWDYGYLNETNEKSYIKTILNACKELTTNKIWFKCTVKSISESQKYFRENEDVSSVSLRDVTRFCRFYNWFYEFAVPSKTEAVHIDKIERASLLAIFLCYYFRLDSSTKRRAYTKIIKHCIKKYKQDISSDFLNKLLESEKMALVKRMELPPGTAKNRALTDNIFVLFTCIVNRLPVILCGQPGSSKTLAVQIIISNLKGKKSADPVFQTLSELIAISYQGSHNCTSESIIKVFGQADKCKQANNDADLLPVIVFDEIGLAELSPHNPLKVLHSELEIETCRYGFVGLSNWRLDASKMNRAIYLSSPNPDLDDLKLTANTLLQSMISNNIQAVPLDHLVIEGLAIAYTQMCEHMKQQGNQHYFGLRDYYSLIKGIVYDMIHNENQEEDLYKIIRHHLSFNFDAIIDGSKFMWSTFCEHLHQNHKITDYASPTFDQLIHHSLSSRTGRFLMLIGESESAFDYVQRYITIKHSSIQTRTLIGSSLEGDYLSNITYTDQYNTRVLMDIILYAEKEITLFLRGLGHLYDNLYDLFNQNFAVSAKKKFCRIALGSLYHPRCMVHDNFYCVVFVKKQDLDKYDPPFLNRFEKHLIDIDTLIDERHNTVVVALTRWIDRFLSTKTNQNASRSRYLSTWFNNDYILNLVTDAFDQVPLSDNDQDMFKYCQEQIIRNSSFDVPLLLSLESSNDCNHIIEQYYEIHTHLSFSSFINQRLQQEKIPKLLIYTYTQIYHIIDYSEINNQQKSIDEIKLSHFKTEVELIQKIKMHYQSGSSRLLCIRVDYHEDHQHLPMLKHLLLNEHIVDESRGICLIFHLQRNKVHQIENDVFFNGWSSVMIDDLEKHQLIPQNILSNPSYTDLVSHLTSLDLETTFDELIHPCIRKFRYIVTDKNREQEINEHCDEIIEQLILRPDKDDQWLRSFIKKHLLEMISNSHQTQFKDWRQDLLTNEIVVGSCRSFIDAFTKNISFFLEKYLSLLLAHIEKHSMIDSYLFLIHSDENIRDKLRRLWIHCWTTIVKNIDMSSMSQTYIEIPLVFDLHLPCATIEYEIIRQIRQTIAQNRQDDDENSIDFAYKQLVNTSIYGPFINTIFTDPDLFDHYYYDQLTLTRNEANIHQLSTSLIQRLLTSKLSGTVKDRLSHLLIDYEELLEIMRVFEIGISFLGEEDMIFEYLSQQFIVDSDTQDKNVRDDNNLYSLVMKEANFYLVSPGSSVIEENIFECSGNPFIEISLMNLLELLVSPTHIDRINNMEEMITIYGLVIQSMIALSHYDHYEINNLEKIQSFLRLASCLSILFPNDKALDILKRIYKHSKDCVAFRTLDQIHNFITYLNNVIHQQQSTADDATIHQTLLKFESELVRNWLVDNKDQYGDILTSINDRNLWRYSAKIFTFIDTDLDLSSTVRMYNGQIPQINDYEEINQYLCQLNDPTLEIEILLNMRIYIQLILDENYQPRINKSSKQQLTDVLKTEFNYFKKNLNEMEHLQNEQRLERISLIAWLKSYLLYYVYALKHDIRDDIMDEIDRILVKNDSAFCSTIKLYIIKQLCYSEKITFHDLCSKYTNRSIVWITSMIKQSLNARRDIILPTPLFECDEEFFRISENLSSHITDGQLKDLIKECSQRQDKTYSFLMWFIHYYTRFYNNNLPPDDQFVQLIECNINRELITTCFELIGYQLIYSLCTNFNKDSYFRLNPSMLEKDLHQRLLVLNIIALLISFKSSKTVSFLGSLLFDADFKMPQNYTEHIKNFYSLTGVAFANDPALIQMINIRTPIDIRKNSKIDIIRCSSDCYWLYCIVNCEIPIEQKQCPLCTKEINVSRNDDLLIINKPHIVMNGNEISQLITQYIEQHKQKDKPLTYHFMNYFTHAIFLFLNEFKYFPHSTPAICIYFQECIATNYHTIRQHLSNVDQCYVWLYKVINHMMNENFVIKGCLNSPEKVIQLEKLIEDKLIIPQLSAAISQIKEYKLLYADFMYENDKDKEIVNFVNELVQNNNEYPLLHFFNVTNIHSINLIDDFHNKLQLLHDYKKTYPLTTFLLERISDYENIPYLYSIIRFMNYLMQQFDHRISRNDAKIKTIADCLKDNSDLQKIYQQFVDVWYKINLKDVQINQHSPLKSNFENKTNISMFLLSKFNDNENMIPTVCLHKLANLQNNIVNYFHSNAVNCRAIPIQSIQQKQLFDFGTNKMRKLLVEKGMMINYKYGMSQEIIYDYDEIEWMLRNEITCLPLIDVKNMRYFNYQFELYDENVSLINDIQKRFEQKLFDDNERAEIKGVLDYFDNHSILQLSGLLESILAYLRTANSTTMTIEKFIREYIHPKGSTDNQIFGKKPFSSIQLQYIIDLNELIEECVFDKIIRDNIRNEFREQSFPTDQRTSITDQFIDIILHDRTIADCLKDLNCWINMFKRLLMRLLSSRMNINYESSLHDYVRRSDMWKGNITEENIRTIEIKSNIRLKHAFIILKGLEAELNEKPATGNDGSVMNNESEQPNRRPIIQRTNSVLRPRNPLPKRKESKKKSNVR